MQNLHLLFGQTEKGGWHTSCPCASAVAVDSVNEFHVGDKHGQACLCFQETDRCDHGVRLQRLFALVVELWRGPRGLAHLLGLVATPVGVVSGVVPTNHAAVAVRGVVVHLGARQVARLFGLVREKGKELGEA